MFLLRSFRDLSKYLVISGVNVFNFNCFIEFVIVIVLLLEIIFKLICVIIFGIIGFIFLGIIVELVCILGKIILFIFFLGLEFNNFKLFEILRRFIL